jgi:flagellar biosynthetic protein FliQ
MRLVIDALMTTALVAGPILAASLFAGILVGLAQAVVQVNEASLSFIVKLLAVTAVLVGLGAGLSETMTSYARRCFTDVERVVR